MYRSHGRSFRIIIDPAQLLGNARATQSKQLKIDATAPVTTLTTHHVKKISVVVTFSATDNLSGVATTEYILDNGANWTTGNALALTESGVYTILFHSTDVAGNWETKKSITVN